MANRQLVPQPRICPALAPSPQRSPLSNSISNFPATPGVPLQQATWQNELVHLLTSKSDTSSINYARASTTINPCPTTTPDWHQAVSAPLDIAKHCCVTTAQGNLPVINTLLPTWSNPWQGGYAWSQKKKNTATAPYYILVNGDQIRQLLSNKTTSDRQRKFDSPWSLLVSLQVQKKMNKSWL